MKAKAIWMIIWSSDWFLSYRNGEVMEAKYDTTINTLFNVKEVIQAIINRSDAEEEVMKLMKG